MNKDQLYKWYIKNRRKMGSVERTMWMIALHSTYGQLNK